MSLKNDKAERLIEAAVAALKGGGGELNRVVFNKALFYADLVALRDLGHTITQYGYLALRQGPVVMGYEKRMIKRLEKRGLGESSESGPAKPTRLTELGRQLGPGAISEQEWSIAESLGQLFKRFNADEASDASHTNPGWLEAWERVQEGGTGRGEPIDMVLALQDEALFDDELLTLQDEEDPPEFLEAFERSETEPTTDW